jgi:DNA (cytosine-5)-methyltransferase 1
MNYGSVCSGVEAASLAWKPLGWTAKFYAEVEPFPSAVLCERFGATRPLRPLDPAEAHNEKDRKLRESWKKQIAELPPVGRIPNLGDFPKIKETDYDGHIDLLVGGCPCQSYSLAGLRKGLADPRGNLTLEFVKLAYRTKARIVVFENVPGILSSGDSGSDFAGFLSLLCGWEVKPPKDGWRKCGIVTNAPGCFGVAWRILDAQYTRVPEFPRAVPQRRRRLILVGHLDSWLYPAKVLFDGEMRGGDTPPRRTKGQGAAAGSEGGIDSARWWNGDNRADTLTTTSNNQFMPDRSRLQCVLDIRQLDAGETEISPTLVATDYKGGKAISFYPQRKAENMVPLEDCSNTLVNGTSPGHHNAVCFENHGTDSRIKESAGVSPTIMSRAGTGGNNLPLVMNGEEPVGFIKNDAGGEQQGYWTGAFPTIRSQVIPAVAIAENVIGRQIENGGNGIGAKEEVAYTQNCTGVMGVCQNATVRRLLPVECERLMGFPDNHTRIPWKGGPEEECPIGANLFLAQAGFPVAWLFFSAAAGASP